MITSFESALPYILTNEGGYSDNPNDPGQETYRGISRKNYPMWKGWEIIDSYKPLEDEERILDPELIYEVHNFYLNEFWNKNKLGELTSQLLARKLFDMCVNMGSYRGGIIAQQALANDCRVKVTIDGIIGEETINLINKQNVEAFLTSLRRRSVNFYEQLVKDRPESQEFLAGWIKRANQ